MLRILAALAVLSAVPALAQSVTDGSDRRISPDQVANVLRFVRENPDLGPSSQVRGLRAVSVSNTTYYCGTVNAGGGWEPFYYDPFSAGGRHGIVATAICGK